MSSRTDMAALLQYVAQCLPPVAVAELRSREQLRLPSTEDEDDGTTGAFQVLSVTLFDARRVMLLKVGFFRRWRAHVQNRRRLNALLERARQLSDDRRMRSALQLWAATAFESRLSAVLLSRGLALCAVLLASAAQVVPGERASVTTSTSFATSFFTYGAALYHAQHTALLATAPARPSWRGRPLVPALRGSVATTAEVQRMDWQQLRQQLAAALTAVRERDAWLRDLQAEHDASQEAARNAAQQLQQQADATEQWRLEAKRWEEAHGVARAQLDDTQGLLQDSCSALERLQTSELTYAMQLARAQSECKHLETQLKAAGEASREAASAAASLTAERDALRESVAAAQATAEAQLSVSEAGRAEAEEACHALRAALQGADCQAAAMLVAVSAEKAELLAQLEEMEARLRQMEAAQEIMLERDGDAASPEPQPSTSALSPLVLSRVLDRMSLVHAQLERVEFDEQQQQGEATMPAASPVASLKLEFADASGDQRRLDAALSDAHDARVQLATLQARCLSLEAALETARLGAGTAASLERTDAYGEQRRLDAAMSDAHEQLAALQARCASLEATLEASTASGSASASEVTALQSRLDTALRDAHSAHEQLAALQARCSSLEAALEAARRAPSPSSVPEPTDASGDQWRIDAAVRDAHDAREQLTALRTRCSSLETALEVATTSASETTALQSRLDDALRHIAALEAQLADMAARLVATEAARDAAATDALRATAELARARMDVRLAKAAADSAQRKAQSQGVQAAPDPPDVGPTPEVAAQLAELQAALADAEARTAALGREVDRVTAERERMAAQLRDWSMTQEGTANRSGDVQIAAAEPATEHSRQLTVAVADALPSAVAAAVDARRVRAAQRLPLGKLEGVLWVRGPAADTPAPPSHGPPQFVWVKQAVTLWSSGVLKLAVNASAIGRNGHAGQEERRLDPAGSDPHDMPAEVDLTACGDVVIASKDSYRHTSLRDRKRYCFHVIRPGGELALAAACGNDAETREWADLMRLFVLAA